MGASDDILNRLLALHPKAIDLSLGRVMRLLNAVGNPHERLPPVIHVAGTNGKGSLVAYLRAMAEAAGLQVHVYTSPHLVRFHERIRLGGALIDEAQLAALLAECERANAGAPITFFEITTVAAMLAFARRPADLLLLEVGLGGRLDATNVVDKPALTAITPVDLDHREFLGPTIEQIAAEKAGIIKTGVPCVLGPQDPRAYDVIKKIAAEKSAPIIAHERDWKAWADGARMIFEWRGQKQSWPLPRLYGAHQVLNAGTAIACLKALPDLKIPDAALERGLLTVEWPARMQRLLRGPMVARLPTGAELWLDGGHNPHAGRMIAQEMEHWRRWPDRDRPVHVIVGMKANKDADGFLGEILPRADRAATIAIPNDPNSFDARTLADKAQALGCETTAAQDLMAALDILLQDNSAPPRILITGSLYLAGHVLADHG